MTYCDECDWMDHKSYFRKNRFIVRGYEYCKCFIFQKDILGFHFFEIIQEIIPNEAQFPSSQKSSKF